MVPSIRQGIFTVVGSMALLSVFKDQFKMLGRQLENPKTLRDEPDTDIGNIVKFTSTGFDISMNDMICERKYLLDFEDSKYIISKNPSDELTIAEIDWY